jgi:hypothetical protein
MKKEFGSYEEMLAFVQGWRTWSGERHMYDYIGIVSILAACLNNLSQNMDVVVEEAVEGQFSKEEIEVIAILAEMLCGMKRV